MNGKHAIYRVYQALCAGMLSLFPAGRQTLVQGDGCITRIPEVLKTHGIKAVQIITTPGTIRRGTIAPLLAQCEDAGIRTVLYTEVSPDPTVAEVEAAAECFFVSGCEAILAIGGGSVMDCAKVAGARTVRRDLPVGKMSGMLKIHKKLPLLLAVPTTAGTGSEVTLAAVITDETCHYKHAVMDYCLIPRYAFLDPGLSCSLPPDMTAYSGMDALTHAIEGLITLGAWEMSDMFETKAIEMIAKWLPKAVENPSDIEARDGMATAQYIAGMAFSNVGLGLVHGMAHPLGAYYDIPHGVANALLLPFVMEYNKEAAKAKYRTIAEAMGVDTSSMSDDEAADAAVKAVKDLAIRVRIPQHLSEIGVPESGLPTLAQAAFNDVCTPGNPRQTNVEEILAIYKKAF